MKHYPWLLAVALLGVAWLQVVHAATGWSSASIIVDLRHAAEQGNAIAQDSLGFSYAQGKGVPQDYTKALKWFRKSAEQGNAFGQFHMGVAYAYGEGVPQDYAKALKWFRKSAEQGDGLAQVSIGLLYVRGQGVPQDYSKAVKWFRKSAEQGNGEGELSLGHAYAIGAGVPRDYAKAAKWLRKSAEQGNADAEKFLALDKKLHLKEVHQSSHKSSNGHPMSPHQKYLYEVASCIYNRVRYNGNQITQSTAYYLANMSVAGNGYNFPVHGACMSGIRLYKKIYNVMEKQ